MEKCLCTTVIKLVTVLYITITIFFCVQFIFVFFFNNIKIYIYEKKNTEQNVVL